MLQSAWKYILVKTRTIDKAVNLFALQIGWLVSTWYEILLKGIYEHSIKMNMVSVAVCNV